MKTKLLFFIAFINVGLSIAQGNCTTAITVGLNSTTTAPAFTNENGTAPTQLCGLNNGGGSKGKWYTFTSNVNGNIRISTVLPQNTGKDTRLIVYSGTCASLVCVGSNDDFNGNSNSQVTFNATVGTVYYIAFDNRFSQSTFDFSVTVVGQPLPDRLSFTSTPVTGIAGTFNNCIVDMNGDYRDDIVSPVSIQNQAGTIQLVIAYQQAGGTFSATTYPASTVVSPSWSIAAGDYDNNGYNDLVYGSSSGVTFLTANSDGTAYTVERKPESYLVQRTNFIDLNNDGKLDIFACDDNAPNRYYLNNGTQLIHHQGGIGDFATGGNYSSVWSDFNNDGLIDMHLSKCGQGGSGPGGNINQLFQNNGDGTYTNIAPETNMADPEQTWSSAIGDFNNDGWMDVVVGVNSLSDGNTNVKRNNGNGTFTSVTSGSGYDIISSTGREYVAHDFDNDGFLDVLGSGSNIMFGDGNFHFTPNPNTYPISTVDRPVGDLNDDGFLDIQNGTNVLFNNGNTNKWIKINLQGIQSNRNGIGARVEIYGSWGKQIRDVQSGTGFQCMSSITTHFGIGQATNIDRIVVKWPSGIIDTLTNVNSSQKLLVVEGSTLNIESFASNSFSIYPIPAKNYIKIDPKNNIELSMADVYDLSGKLVKKNLDPNTDIDVSNLSSGTYIILVKDKDGRNYSSKFIKE